MTVQVGIAFQCTTVLLEKAVSITIKYQRTNGPVNAHLSLLHIPINMFEYYGI